MNYESFHWKRIRFLKKLFGTFFPNLHTFSGICSIRCYLSWIPNEHSIFDSREFESATILYPILHYPLHIQHEKHWFTYVRVCQRGEKRICHLPKSRTISFIRTTNSGSDGDFELQIQKRRESGNHKSKFKIFGLKSGFESSKSTACLRTISIDFFLWFIFWQGVKWIFENKNELGLVKLS